MNPSKEKTRQHRWASIPPFGARCRDCHVDRADPRAEQHCPMKPMTLLNGIYAASKTSHAAMWRAIRERGVMIISTWVDEAGPGQTEDLSELWFRIEQEIRMSRFLVLYAEKKDFPLRGALVECGMALALGKPVRVVLPGVKLEGDTLRPIGSWIKDRRVRRFDELEEALKS